MSALIILAAVNCAEPRATFGEFYARYFYSGDGSGSAHWAGSRGEDFYSVNSRVLNATGSYVDYAEAYRDQCGRK